MKLELDKLRLSGRISATALAHGRKMIVPGTHPPKRVKLPWEA